MKFRFIMASAFILLSTLHLISCSSIPLLSSNKIKYNYRYTMVYPSNNDQLLYRDDSIYVQFRIDDGAVRFQMRNISQADAEILWDRAFIGIKNKFSPVRCSRNLYADSLTCIPSTILPPYVYMIDFVMPARNFFFDGKKWKELTLFPITETRVGQKIFNVNSLIGTTLTLNLPIRFENNVREYSFQFVVSAIDKIPWSQYRPPRRPPPPPRKGNFETVDQIITAAAVIGIIGVATVFLTQKKVPPGD